MVFKLMKGNKMSEQIFRKSMLFPQSVWEPIEDFRFDQRIKSDTEALRILIQAGLHYFKLKQDAQFEQAEQATIERINAQG